MDATFSGQETLAMHVAALAAVLAFGVTAPEPIAARRFEPIELAFHASETREDSGNPFTEVSFSARFTHESGEVLDCEGFFDGDGEGGQQGDVFKIRFAPPATGRWEYRTRSNLRSLHDATGAIDCGPAAGPGPAIVSAEAPHRFLHAGSREPYFPLGATAYHLLSPANDDAAIVAALDSWKRHGFNRLRFLLSGYPRDADRPAAPNKANRNADLWKRSNYGAPAGSTLPLPAWLGKPHAYDFARFDLAYWHKVDRAIRAMRERGLVACAIFTIEKQDLPAELGAGSEAEILFYRYAIDRLAAFDNVWWDLGNEHNEYRDAAWTKSMGEFVKRIDPYDRLLSAHGYAEWRYGQAAWADFVVTQHSGAPAEANAWVLKYRDLNKPYVNEEYGYEGVLEEWGQGQKGDLARQSHWAIAMAGGYATYGRWDDEASFYSGRPNIGPGGEQLHFLREFFAQLPDRNLAPANERLPGGFCLTDGQNVLAGYLPALPADSPLEAIRVDLNGLETARELTWFDPRTGNASEPVRLDGDGSVRRPSRADWAFTVR